jgi:hypothetical protein
MMLWCLLALRSDLGLSLRPQSEVGQPRPTRLMASYSRRNPMDARGSEFVGTEMEFAGRGPFGFGFAAF